MDVSTGWTRSASTRHLRAFAITVVLLVLGITLVPAAQADSTPTRVSVAASHLRVARQSVLHLQRHMRSACRSRATSHCKAHRRELRRRIARHRRALRAVRAARVLAHTAVVRRARQTAGSKDTTTSASTTGTTATEPAAAPATSPSPAAVNPSSAPAATAASAGFQPGIVAGSAPLYDLPDVARLGAKVARVEFSVTASVASIRPVIAGYADRGVRVLLLAGFQHGRLPSSADSQNVASWAREFGPGGAFWADRSDSQLAVQSIEFGNETSYEYQGTQNQGGTYALRFKDAQVAIQGANRNVGLLAQADDQANWIDDMFAAVPDLGSRVAGWTVHPYIDDWGASRISRIIQKTAAHGAPSNIPIDITEWGLATDNGACLDDNYGHDKCMTYAAAAATMTARLAGLKAETKGRLGLFMLYRVTDLAAPRASTGREDYFGALKQDGSSKGTYTDAVRTVLAS